MSNEAMDNFSFGCNKCGKCCFLSPHLNPLEIFDYSDKFIIQMAHHAHFSFEKEPLAKEQIKHLDRLGHTIAIPEFDRSMFYYVDFATIKYPTAPSCDFLSNNLCNLQNFKPTLCQLSPINPYYSEIEQYKSFKIWETFDKFDCNKKDIEKNIIWEKNKITHIGAKIGYDKHIENVSRFTDLYMQYLKNNTTPDNNIFEEHLKTVFKFAEKNHVILGDMVIALHVFLFYGIVDKDSVIHFINNQLLLIDEKIKFALLRLNKDDRQTTNLLRKQKESYLKALNDPNFFTESDNGFIKI